MSNFHRIGLLTKLHHREVIETLNHLVRFLSAGGWELVVEATAASLLDPGDYEVASRDVMGNTVDLVIVVGGDGSMLSAARDMLDYNVPLLGVNRGRLGFLTDILPHEVEERVTRVLGGDFTVSDRFLLAVVVTRQGKEIARGLALNDIVLHPGKSVRMMEFELYVDHQIVYSQRSDGLIVSTPTGSTAYALSAGGPIVHPHIDALVLVPMNPHTLTGRPIAVPGKSLVEIRVGKRNELHPLVTCDGQLDITTEPEDIITIAKETRKLRLIHPVDHDFYSICRSKLGWGSRLDATEYFER